MIVKEFGTIQEFINKNKLDVTVDAVIDYYREYYKENSSEINDYITVCKYCKKELDIIISLQC